MKKIKNKSFNRLCLERTVRSSEDYTVLKTEVGITSAEVVQGLSDGTFNLIHHSLRDDLSMVIDDKGRVVVLLEHDGGSGPDQNVKVTIHE